MKRPIFAALSGLVLLGLATCNGAAQPLLSKKMAWGTEGALGLRLGVAAANWPPTVVGLRTVNTGSHPVLYKKEPESPLLERWDEWPTP